MATPLGPPSHWPIELVTAANIVLASQFPAALVWGDQLVTIHNEAFVPILSGKKAQGRSFADVWMDVWDEISPIVKRAYRGEATFVEDFPLMVERFGHRDQAYFTFCYSPVIGSDGQVLGMIDFMVETTARVKAEIRDKALVLLGDRLRDAQSHNLALFTAASIVGPALGAVRAGYRRIDRDAGFFTVDVNWTRDGATDLTGEYSFSKVHGTVDRLEKNVPFVVTDIAGDPRVAPELEFYRAISAISQVKMPLFNGDTLVGLFFVHDDKPRIWTDEEVTFVQAVADRTYAAIAKLDAENQQSTLNAELDHRLKNMMAMVQAIASQTLGPSADPEAYKGFANRIAALGQAHELLLGRNASKTTIAAVVKNLLALHDRGRFVIEGADVALGPKAAVGLALMLHELATNAVKYGALSGAKGIVHLSWYVERDLETPQILFRWTESGGPPVGIPGRRGFGSKLIRLGITGAGGVETIYDPDGIKVTFRGALQEVQND